ncbi:MAG: HNH endonuclease [Epulopiscium sp.]|nr:HNH endonuclease [Candidatus Epulonipiscium sp.]
MSRFYTDENLDWLMKNSDKYNSYEEIAKDFNKEFSTTRTVSAVQQCITKNLNIKLNTPRNETYYTEEEEKWLVENYDKYETIEMLAKGFNAKFSRNKDRGAISDKCSKGLKLKRVNPTRFKKGHSDNDLKIGTIRKGGNGCTYIKVKDVIAGSNTTGYQAPFWQPLQKKIYEDHYGEVPEGKMVIFLDCDRENFNIENLYCIDRRISMILASNGWYSTEREVTLAGIKYAELHYLTKEF